MPLGWCKMAGSSTVCRFAPTQSSLKTGSASNAQRLRSQDDRMTINASDVTITIAQESSLLQLNFSGSLSSAQDGLVSSHRSIAIPRLASPLTSIRSVTL